MKTYTSEEVTIVVLDRIQEMYKGSSLHKAEGNNSSHNIEPGQETSQGEPGEQAPSQEPVEETGEPSNKDAQPPTEYQETDESETSTSDGYEEEDLANKKLKKNYSLKKFMDRVKGKKMKKMGGMMPSMGGASAPSIPKPPGTGGM